MTKEQAIKKIQAIIDCDLRELNTMPQHEALKNEVEALDMAIKALEQQPSEDCVSRKSLLDKLDPLYKEKIKTAPDNMAEGFLQVSNLIKYEPPVTPIHGTCKDCRNARESHYNKCIYCTRIERNCVEDFYCKAYRKTR